MKVGGACIIAGILLFFRITSLLTSSYYANWFKEITVKTGYVSQWNLGIGPKPDSNIWDNFSQDESSSSDQEHLLANYAGGEVEVTTENSVTNVMNQVYWFMYKKRLKQ